MPHTAPAAYAEPASAGMSGWRQHRSRIPWMRGYQPPADAPAPATILDEELLAFDQFTARGQDGALGGAAEGWQAELLEKVRAACAEACPAAAVVPGVAASAGVVVPQTPPDVTVTGVDSSEAIRAVQAVLTKHGAEVAVLENTAHVRFAEKPAVVTFCGDDDVLLALCTSLRRATQDAAVRRVVKVLMHILWQSSLLGGEGLNVPALVLMVAAAHRSAAAGAPPSPATSPASAPMTPTSYGLTSSLTPTLSPSSDPPGTPESAWQPLSTDAPTPTRGEDAALLMGTLALYGQRFDTTASMVTPSGAVPLLACCAPDPGGLWVCHPVDPAVNVAAACRQAPRIQGLMRHCAAALGRWDGPPEAAPAPAPAAFGSRSPLASVVAFNKLAAAYERLPPLPRPAPPAAAASPRAAAAEDAEDAPPALVDDAERDGAVSAGPPALLGDERGAAAALG